MVDPVYLTFSQMRNNAKLTKLLPTIRAAGYRGETLVFNLPSGPLHTCPFAKDCAASAMPFDANGQMLPVARRHEAVKWKVVNGPEQQFRCYAASLEGLRSQVRDVLHVNLDLLKDVWRRERQIGIEGLLFESLDEAGAWDNGSVVRVHSHGEFFHRDYFNAWLWIAAASPSNRYYAYTKAVAWYLDAWVEGRIPKNFAFTMSRGGTQDELIDLHSLKESVVVASEQEAYDLDLEVDHDDSHALFSERSFALVIHGTGNAGYLGSSKMLREIIPLELVAAD